MSDAVLTARLHALSPLHIGCGEVYEPTSFWMDVATQSFVLFDPADLLRSLGTDERRRFDAACSGTDLLAVMKLVRSLGAKAPALARIPVPQDLVKRYEEVLSSPAKDQWGQKKVLNQFLLERTSFLPYGNLPYVPGSSLKGSIRTALLNHLQGGRSGHLDARRPRELEQELLQYRNFDMDPFRLLKVPDLLPALGFSTRVLFAHNVKKRGGDVAGRGPVQYLETIQPGSRFEGVLRLDAPLPAAGIRLPLTLKDLVAAARQFYEHRFHREAEEMQQIGLHQQVENLERALAEARGRLGPSAVLVRVGRHSGAEALTLDGIRQIRIMTGPGKPARTGDQATTLWLASESRDPARKEMLKAFGWAVLELAPVEPGATATGDAARVQARADRTGEVSAARHAWRRAAAERVAMARELEERRSREAEEQNYRTAEEARRRAEWDELPEEERFVRTPALPTVTEQQVVGCYNKLDTLASPFKERLAAALRDYYQRVGKWDVKPKQEKQYNKVRKIQSILGG